MLKRWISFARKHRASDLHLEPDLPLALRVRGQLRAAGEPIPAQALMAAAREIVPEAHWDSFLERRSFDAARVVAGTYCRINVLVTARGVGLAVRLLASFEPTLAALNLQPELAELARAQHGLVIVCGPTGSGKSSTLAALVHEVDCGAPRHVITIENPIEYHFRARNALIRQREVGRDTPSFEQALLDALREDPDVLVVGEMRRRETIQRTLDVAETGHLVFTTMHAGTVVEAIARVVSAFPSGSQAGVRAQLADSLLAVVSQRLVYRPEAGIRVPECEVLRATPAVRANIRDGVPHKLQAVMETGARDGMWTLERYRRWLDERRLWSVPKPDDEELVAPPPPSPVGLAPLRSVPAPSAGPARAASDGPAIHVVEADEEVAVDQLIAELEGR